MKPEYYRILGWACVFIPALVAFNWCTNRTGLAGWLLSTFEKLLQVELVQITWLLTFAILVFPGYLAKRYLDERAWDLHLKSLPPPDKREAAKRSKYVVAETPPLAPATPAVDIKAAQQTGKDYIATCTACGHLFPVAAGTSVVKCPTCDETLS